MDNIQMANTRWIRSPFVFNGKELIEELSFFNDGGAKIVNYRRCEVGSKDLGSCYVYKVEGNTVSFADKQFEVDQEKTTLVQLPEKEAKYTRND